ncbi:MAG: UDP-N-acetylmuramate dehydrogenase [Bacteroidota bacterium]
MQILPNHSLKNHNTFQIDVRAKAFVQVHNLAELRAALSQPLRPLFILGGGSNMLLTKDLDALVIKNSIKGIRIIRSYRHCVHVEAGAGEDWHGLVRWCLSHNLAGLENLSLIPGTVGAAPIQNIGAYGVELTDVFVRLEAIHRETGERRIFRHADCVFAYRDSIFKNELKDQYIITRVVLRLSRQAQPNTSYGAIRQTLEKMGIQQPTIQDISKAVIQIRSSKLPDPAVIGNSGSFFKNPVVKDEQFQHLIKDYPTMPHYRLSLEDVKIPAGWLIEQCGWKGKRIGDAGCHERQALVLVNHGKATGQEILALSKQIQTDVWERFRIRIIREVNVID